MSLRINRRFDVLKKAGRSGLVTFLTAGDPDYATSIEIVKGLPAAGADLIELGMPFSDPMADGPAIQAANLRALANGMTLKKTLQLVAEFRQNDNDTPIILMGYYNPIHHYGKQAFLDDAISAGVDGLIVVDLPAEEDDELCHPAMTAGIDWIKLTTPTTNDARLDIVLENSSGFVYYVSIAGVTGTASAQQSDIDNAVKRIKRHTRLPVAVGFGIKTAQQVEEIATIADAAVVGSAVVERIASGIENQQSSAQIRQRVLTFVSDLATGIK